MISLPYYVFNSILLFGIGSALLIVGVGVLYIRTIRKYLTEKEKRIKMEDNLDAKVAERIKEARKKSEEIIEKAVQEAEEITQSATNFTQKTKGFLEKDVDSTSKEYLHYYQEILNEVGKEAVERMDNVSEDIKGDLKIKVEDFTKSLYEKIVETHSVASKALQDTYKKAELEVEDYKNKRIQDIENSLLHLVERIVKKVLEREISLEEHEKLVIKSFEEAKRQKMFK